MNACKWCGEEIPVERAYCCYSCRSYARNHNKPQERKPEPIYYQAGKPWSEDETKALYELLRPITMDELVECFKRTPGAISEKIRRMKKTMKRGTIIIEPKEKGYE